MQTAQEIVINVQEIEPRLRHLTIFQVFDSLQEGESLIIHNNHDPKPVYYQLQELRGDVFTWEYLEQGPEWWDIRVTKKQNNVPAIAVSQNGDIIINVPTLAPSVKHATIFKTFEDLEEGKSLIIHNDHDPKPVYYQLLGDYGDVFTWEYLLQGPEWWDIRVTKKGSESEESIGDMTAKDWRKAQVFKKYGIDFCCGGKKTVREVCAEKGIDATKVEKELQEVSKLTSNGGYTNYDEWNLDFLADYIVNTHHQYVRKNMPEILQYSAKVTKVHGAQHPELAPIHQLVEKINEELSAHMIEEENILFPMSKKIVQAHNAGTTFTPDNGESLTSLVDKMEHEHDSVGRAFDKIRALNDNYAIPADGCASYKLLYQMLADFENDLFTHIHLENNILFPKTIEIAKSII